jgi:hypothetical protein
MFTIKHVAADGSEFAMECASYYVDRTEHEGRFRFRTFDTPYRTDTFSMLWAGDGPHTSEHLPDTIYVMNRDGATVAKYCFHRSHREESGEAQADPAKLAA